MDFLDPRKERRNRIVLFLSYGLIAIAIALTSRVLLYQTDGYCLDKTGEVDRCGLVFLSSQPQPAEIRIDGKLQKAQTNTKINLRSGTYNVLVTKDGYRPWQRTIGVTGGDVQRFDYPFLFPKNLRTSLVTTIEGGASFATQSPDKRWLIVGEGVPMTRVRVYDIKNPAKPTSTTVILSPTIVTPGEQSHAWFAVEWSDNNRHVLLSHAFTSAGNAAQEYILFDRQTATPRNLTRELSLIELSYLRVA